MIITDVCFSLVFSSMKRTLARYDKSIDSSEVAILEYREEVFSETCIFDLLAIYFTRRSVFSWYSFTDSLKKLTFLYYTLQKQDYKEVDALKDEIAKLQKKQLYVFF